METEATRRRRRYRGPVGAIVISVLLAACSGRGSVPVADPPPKPSPAASATATAQVVTPETTPTEPPTPTPPPRPQRVLVISLDGMRADALEAERTPVLLDLARSGAFSLSAQTVLPSATLPAHGSMLSGYDVADHGLTWNDYVPRRGYILTETLFSIAHAAGLRTEMVVAKEKLVHIATPGTVDRFTYILGGDFAIASQAEQSIAAGFDVLFVHLIGPDAAGHSAGWMSPIYFGTIGNTDAAVGRVLAALAASGALEQTLIIVTADHGGHGHLHGSASPEDMTIPWIVAGPGVVPGVELATAVTVYDTAATALWALGLPLPADLDGTPVLEAFGLEPTALHGGIPKVTFPAPGQHDRVMAPPLADRAAVRSG